MIAQNVEGMWVPQKNIKEWMLRLIECVVVFRDHMMMDRMRNAFPVIIHVTNV